MRRDVEENIQKVDMANIMVNRSLKEVNTFVVSLAKFITTRDDYNVFLLYWHRLPNISKKYWIG